MRLSLIQPPLFQSAEEDLVLPVGLIALATYVKEKGHNPIIIDLNRAIKNGELSYSRRFIKETAHYILKKQSKILGFSVLASSLPVALLIAEECKRVDPRIFIVFGGAEVSFEEETLLNNFKQIDAVVRGEGEITITQLLAALDQGNDFYDIEGLTFRDRTGIVRNRSRQFIQDLDKLPFLEYGLLPHLKEYKQGAMEGGRGCPYRCTFCSTSRMWGRCFRLKSPKRLVEELEYVSKIFNSAKEGMSVKIIHDNLLTIRERATSFLKILKTHKCIWSCFGRLDALDTELVKMLGESGCTGLFIGIESGSDQIQKYINKNVPLKLLSGILEQISNNRIVARLSFILGLPGENKETMDQTLWCALRSKLYDCQPKVQIHLFTMLKGSSYYDEMKTMLANKTPLTTDFSSFITGLSAERKIVEGYPAVFPSFYPHYKRFDVRYLEKISDLYCYLAETFPIATVLLLNMYKLEPSEFADKILSHLERREKNWQNMEVDEFARIYEKYVKIVFPKANYDKSICQAIIHETTLQKLGVASGHSPNIDQNLPMRSYPIVAKGICLKKYDYNMSDIMRALRKGRRKISENETTYAYIAGKEARAIALTPTMRKLLKLCDGRSNIKQIIDKMVNKGYDKNQRNEARENVLQAIINIHKCGLVQV